MPIVEEFMQPGQFTIPLSEETDLYRVWERMQVFGHIVVLPQWVQHPRMHSDAELLAAARYTGVVLRTTWASRNIHIWGQGLWWHLGDHHGDGPKIDTWLSYTDELPSDVFPDLLPDGIALGTITDTDAGLYTGDHLHESCSEAIRTVLKDRGMHARINPNFTFDACHQLRDEVFLITAPKVIALRRGWGSDPEFEGVEAARVETTRDASNWVSTVEVLDEDPDSFTSAGFIGARSHTYFDGLGNPLTRTAYVSRATDDDLVNPGGFIENELLDRDVDDRQVLDAAQWELVNGSLNVGDNFYAFDPPSSLVDTANQVRFRGEFIWPKKVRCLEASTPLTEGMGIYYRPSAATVVSADWIDITRWVEWEERP